MQKVLGRQSPGFIAAKSSWSERSTGAVRRSPKARMILTMILVSQNY
jgi:hypothetical protein